MAASSHQYTALFTIGAKLAGSFRGVMAQAQARLKSLQSAARHVGAAVAKLGVALGGLGAVIGAFGLSKIFHEIFEGADEAAAAFDTRTRKLTATLMLNHKVAAGGLPLAEKQVALIYEHNEALAKQGVIGKELLDTAAANLAMANVPPRQIMAATDAMADMLVVFRGVNASQEDMMTFSKALAISLKTGVSRGLRNFGIIFTPEQQKAFKGDKDNVMDAQSRYAMLMKFMAKYSGQNIKATTSNLGIVKRFNNELDEMRIRMGFAALPARAKMAQAWSKILPEVEPILNDLRALGFQVLGSLADFVGKSLVPAFKTLSAWWKTEGGKAFADMFRELGRAFIGIFRGANDAKKSMGQIIQERLLQALKLLTKLFNWIGKNAKWLVPTIITLTAAFAGLLITLQVAAAIAAIANPVGLVIVAITALTAGIVLLYQNWDKIKEAFPTGAAIIEGWINGLILQFKMFISIIKAVWKTVVALFTGDWTGVAEAWATAWKDMVNWGEWAKGVLVEIAKVVGQAFKDYFLRVFEDIKAIWTWMTTWKAPSWLPSAQLATQAIPAGAVDTGIPHFATGGIVTKPTVAKIGEAGPEAVIPLTGKALGGFDTFTKATDIFNKSVVVLMRELAPALTKFIDVLTKPVAAGGYGGIAGAVGGAVGGYGGAGAVGAGVAAATAAAQSASAQMPLTPEALKAVQAERADVMKDLMRPELRNLVSATLSTEAGGAEDQKNILEAMVNRGVAQQRAGTYKGMENIIKGGFYGPYNRGETTAVMAKGLSDARSQQVGGMLQEIQAGRNALGGLTDQGMVNEIKGSIKERHGEDYFGKLGIPGEEQIAAYKMSRMQAGGVVSKPTVAQIGEKGPEAVVPLSRMGQFWKDTKYAFSEPWMSMGRDIGSLYNTIKTTGRLPQGMLGTMDPATLTGPKWEQPMSPKYINVPSMPTQHINFSPTVTIQGNATEAEQRAMDERLRNLSRDFVAQFKRAQLQERRLSYEGGYG